MRYPVQKDWAKIKTSVPNHIKNKIRWLSRTQEKSEAEVIRTALEMYITREERRASA